MNFPIFPGTSLTHSPITLMRARVERCGLPRGDGVARALHRGASAAPGGGAVKHDTFLCEPDPASQSGPPSPLRLAWRLMAPHGALKVGNGGHSIRSGTISRLLRIQTTAPDATLNLSCHSTLVSIILNSLRPVVS